MLSCDWLIFNSCDWRISVLAVSVICSLGDLLSYGSPAVVFLERGHPCFWNFYSTVPDDAFSVKSYVVSSLTLRVTLFRSKAGGV